ncbi:DUF4157 domain-containing protein [Rhodovulum visakhapatnamense]|uniref:Uncharacterized protein DUF4157 n=1 Tax=Rhodovulum visakhapatnamense TaxID=364297 RepID=A0A4R8G6R6_9RHOB|nr:DUF4157 domain-containing protein [Rhodovulum visakhapatnamense]TDX32515.1 uncharacterized protein DUF4157 [Rhodovulum visakhapatnamense]
MAQIFQSERGSAGPAPQARGGARAGGPQEDRLSALQAKADAATSGGAAARLGALRAEALQRAEAPEEEEPLQGKALQRVEEDEPLQGKALQRKGGSKTGLPERLRSGVERLSGVDMSHVRVHYNSSRPAAVQAHAYAQGSDIHLGPGQEKHLPHEAWHTVQQAKGRVRPTTEVAGTPVNDSPALESEADRMGAKAERL